MADVNTPANPGSPGDKTKLPAGPEKTHGAPPVEHRVKPPGGRGPSPDRSNKDNFGSTDRNRGSAGQALKGPIDRTWEERNNVNAETSQKANAPSPGTTESGKVGNNARLTGKPSQTQRCQPDMSGVGSAAAKGAAGVSMKKIGQKFGIPDKVLDKVIPVVLAGPVGTSVGKFGDAIERQIRCIEPGPGDARWQETGEIRGRW